MRQAQGGDAAAESGADHDDAMLFTGEGDAVDARGYSGARGGVSGSGEDGSGRGGAEQQGATRE
ncbi:hypothetical protein OHB26_22065 [Nocardia sp. NBC_01503]|uniref:hypothetical protein n=1 Tax=Nocardia sp. NBC_01503 TaxID=2975997 RepID=UPI002E7B6858|nr:hypothetical protein [Nocardia sp. NBC_01503]WTL36596.1 hypothetical protein OHB26_22065 [Nocardia sp. NBC_01503]